MESSQFLEILKPYLTREFPDMEEEQERTLSAVLVVIHFSNGDPYVVLTKRSRNLKNHAGQISFPGGTLMASDASLMQTAIRETMEEIGVRMGEAQIAGILHSVITLTSSFIIVPFVAVVEQIGSLSPNREEIDEVLDLPLLDLLRTVSPDLEHSDHRRLYKFEYGGNVVWGATARILRQIYDILRERGMI
ncbi:MAG: NUDIX hydrolase [Nitrososphaerales archaeon]